MATPRVVRDQLGNYVGKKVIIIVEVAELDESTRKISCDADGEALQCILEKEVDLGCIGPVTELHGTVTGKNSLNVRAVGDLVSVHSTCSFVHRPCPPQVTSTTKLSDDFNLSLSRQVILLAHKKYPGTFGCASA